MESVKRNRAIIAMSGGVDSSVAALLMQREGYDCLGVTMKLFRNEDIGQSREKACCSLEDAEDARSVAHSLGMPHYVFNFSEDFETQVIGRFVLEYVRGRTPNPCIDCNRYLKFDRLLRRSEELGCAAVATGHYARVEEAAGRMLLKTGLDEDKDQSYVLYSLTQAQLRRVRLPLGCLTKSEVRAIAEEHGFVNAKKRESQDICFVPEGKYGDFIENYLGKTFPEGDFIDAAGNVLGRHRGVIRYTVGQRKGLGLSFPEPRYVCALDPEKNTVTLGREEELFASALDAEDVNLIACDSLEQPLRLQARVRYHQKPRWATVTQTGEKTLHLDFEEPQRAPARGQAVVLYDGDVVVGGGTII